MEDTFDFSEVSNIINNDSDGHLLAQYLKKKSGKVFPRRQIFEENQNRMSIDVPLRKADNNEKENTKALQQNISKQNSENPVMPLKQIEISSPTKRVNNVNLASPVRVSARPPLPSYIRRTPGSSDILRLSALKRSAATGHRALLDAFNNVAENSTDGEFIPPLASTPLFSEQQITSENAKGTTYKKPSEGDGAPSSPHRYIIERGKFSGQILLTPLPLPNQNNGNNLNTTYTTERHEKDNQTSQNQNELRGSKRLSELRKNSQNEILLTPTKGVNNNGTVVHVTSPRSNVQISCDERQVIITPITSPIREHIPAKKTPVVEEVEIQQTNSAPMRTCDENQCESTAPNIQKHNSPAPLPNPDIMTDDEAPSSSTDKETDSPASHKINHSLRIRKLRQKRSKDRHETKNKNYATPTNATNLRDTQRRRCLPLNKAPRTPINGEKFADELKKQLAGLSNRQVLDLRRRKSSSSFRKNNSGKSSKIKQPFQINAKKTKKAQNANVLSNNLVIDDSNRNRIEQGDKIGLQIVETDSQPEEEDVDSTIISRNEKGLRTDCPPSFRSYDYQLEEQTVESSKGNRHEGLHSPLQLDADQFEGQTGKNRDEDCHSSHQLDAAQFEGQTGKNRDEDLQGDFLLPRLDGDQIEAEVFEDERSSDRISFIPKAKRSMSLSKKGRKTKKNKATNEICESYINATNQIRESASKVNETKRSLYSENINTSQEDALDISPIRIVPPPPMFRSSTPRKRTPPISPLRNNPSNTEISNVDTRREDSAIFKKPVGVAPKRKKTKAKVLKNPSEEDEAVTNETTIRRSQRDRKQVPVPLFWKMLEANLIKSREIAEKRKTEKWKKSRIQNSKVNTEHETLPIASSTANPTPASSKNRGRNRKNTVLTKITEDDIQDNALSSILPTISESSNQVQNTISEDGQISTMQIEDNQPLTHLSTVQKPQHLHARTRRLNTANSTKETIASPPEITSSMSPSSRFPDNDTVDSTPRLSFNFVNWLKNGSNEQMITNLSQQSFTHMSLSAYTDLNFKSLNNVQYAFYNTNQNNIGYIRLQPGQMKPSCRAKNCVNFIILSGKIKLDTDGDIAYPKEGDLVTINADSRYSIENMSDDISILLFIKA